MIIIIPGLFGTRERYNPLLNKLQKVGLTAKVIDLGLNTRGLKNTSEIVKKQLTETSEKHDIIAHSFGGIVLKYIIHHYPEVKKNISSIIFVAVPHGGSWQALFLTMVPAARELLPFRKKIKELAKVSLPEETVNFIPESELKVWPRKSGLLKDYIGIVIPDTNHDNIINSENFIPKVITFIKSRHDKVFL
ncbi:MAG: alpha/beta hydrolase [Candidatus Pacebacteria bacterium]|nr:alpha/beta hydrolase [Candidatus Paceibacterota bacterium]